MLDLELARHHLDDVLGVIDWHACQNARCDEARPRLRKVGMQVGDDALALRRHSGRLADRHPVDLVELHGRQRIAGWNQPQRRARAGVDPPVVEDHPAGADDVASQKLEAAIVEAEHEEERDDDQE